MMARVDPRQFPDAQLDARGQFGALCWRMHRGHAQVLLITSRDTGRWIIPKGWPMAGRTGFSAAMQEAWEEAGVEGRRSQDGPIGYYGYDKVIKPGVALPCMVTVFALRVLRLRDKFPERKERRRKWFDAARAARKVAEPELRALLLAVAAEPGLLKNPPPDLVAADATASEAAHATAVQAGPVADVVADVGVAIGFAQVGPMQVGPVQVGPGIAPD